MDTIKTNNNKKTLQESVAYRIGPFTSKVSIQPSIFEAVLSTSHYDEAKTRQVFRELAIEGKELGAKDVSLYVQSKALLSVLPTEITDKVIYKIGMQGRTPIRFTNPVTNKVTKLTTFTVLIDILNVIYEDKAKDIHTAFASDYCKKRAAADPKSAKRCDLSHHVRERIISNLSAMFG